MGCWGRRSHSEQSHVVRVSRANLGNLNAALFSICVSGLGRDVMDLRRTRAEIPPKAARNPAALEPNTQGALTSPDDSIAKDLNGPKRRAWRLAVELRLGGFVGSVGFVPTDSKGQRGGNGDWVRFCRRGASFQQNGLSGADARFGGWWVVRAGTLLPRQLQSQLHGLCLCTSNFQGQTRPQDKPRRRRIIIQTLCVADTDGRGILAVEWGKGFGMASGGCCAAAPEVVARSNSIFAQGCCCLHPHRFPRPGLWWLCFFLSLSALSLGPRLPKNAQMYFGRDGNCTGRFWDIVLPCFTQLCMLFPVCISHCCGYLSRALHLCFCSA